MIDKIIIATNNDEALEMRAEVFQDYALHPVLVWDDEEREYIVFLDHFSMTSLETGKLLAIFDNLTAGLIAASTKDSPDVNIEAVIAEVGGWHDLDFMGMFWVPLTEWNTSTATLQQLADAVVH